MITVLQVLTPDDKKHLHAAGTFTEEVLGYIE